uniref:Uncharacterized protein n=1 Tax=Candidatus Kentrum sp. FM TaxID=2126340 RepID=A0A450SNG3_9GAMM|nr:MAG: hypothetical protein BECKFM1743A_GA0114220_101324 [Candidatus Kentron sp. FM]VFJ55372.1 MAG: hypothetical protein BECKFM1743C_GA0114222_101564 [Candidatus Kentron sp. FM]VFK10415.1 MAG: hypothetical protein BECKFM1743B_GA0114221_101395 [Candidatus Kentron sp. FM]
MTKILTLELVLLRPMVPKGLRSAPQRCGLAATAWLLPWGAKAREVYSKGVWHPTGNNLPTLQSRIDHYRKRSGASPYLIDPKDGYKHFRCEMIGIVLRDTMTYNRARGATSPAFFHPLHFFRDSVFPLPEPHSVGITSSDRNFLPKPALGNVLSAGRETLNQVTFLIR